MTSTPHALFDELYHQFNDHEGRPRVVAVPGEEVPEPYHTLLVHPHHMTVTLEEFYGEPVTVVVLDSVQRGEVYARKILLQAPGRQKTVLYGLVQVNLSMLAPAVREEIVAGQTPLGRVLIQHEVLREVRPVGYFRVELRGLLAVWMGVPEGTETYGRVGVITADGHPAVRVAEILGPVTRPAR